MRRATISTTTIFIIFLITHAHASAQTRPAGAPPLNAQATRAVSSSADEDFELNIDQRRIHEGDFHAETAVSAEGARGLQLNVGVSLRASDIDALLRNVRGRVRFRATLDTVLRLLDSRRDTTRQSEPTPPPP